MINFVMQSISSSFIFDGKTVVQREGQCSTYETLYRVSEVGCTLPAFRVILFLPSRTLLGIEICSNGAFETVTALLEACHRPDK